MKVSFSVYVTPQNTQNYENKIEWDMMERPIEIKFAIWQRIESLKIFFVLVLTLNQQKAIYKNNFKTKWGKLIVYKRQTKSLSSSFWNN